MNFMKLGLYIHWPFCLSKCPYCDFNSHLFDQINFTKWEACLKKELDYYSDLTKGRIITSIFFGGGTPSLMPPSLVQNLLNHIANKWSLQKNLEITLEANPTSCEYQKFKNLQKAGINRLSLGIQSFEPEALHFLGRTHSVTDAKKAISISQEIFKRASFDLIYARPSQTLKSWKKELKSALQLSQGHLSLYQLTIEPQTAFYAAYQRGEFQMPDEEKAAEFYALTEALTKEANLLAYEISNYAIPGEESQHNLTYWHYEDYIGIGPGAHGRLTLEGKKYALHNHRAPAIYLNQIEKQNHSLKSRSPLSKDEQKTEAIMMGMRLIEGIDLQKLQAQIKLPYEELFNEEEVTKLLNLGFLKRTKTHLKTNFKGRLLLNQILSKIIV